MGSDSYRRGTAWITAMVLAAGLLGCGNGDGEKTEDPTARNTPRGTRTPSSTGTPTSTSTATTTVTPTNTSTPTSTASSTVSPTVTPTATLVRPNVLFIFADDLGYGDLGSYGNEEIATPNLDRLAGEGARFRQFYVGAAVCTPSRAALLTGRYPIRMVLDPRGVFFPDSTGGLDPAEVTIAEMLHERGYLTALVGKWHLGHLPEFLPTRQGFEEFFGLPYSNDMNAPHYPGRPAEPHPCNVFLPGCRPGVPLMEGEQILEMPALQETLTERYTEKAVHVMRRAVATERPFFLYYAHHAPHTPLYASEEFLGRSRGGLYGDVVEELDWSVGELLREIRDLGIDDETLVVFTSDNGPWLLWATDAPVPQGGLDSGSAGILRNGKSTTFEGGMRVPLIARLPGRIPAGRTIDEPAAMIDWMPTLARLAGATPPAVPVDGKDIAALLEGTGGRDPDGVFRYLYYRQDNSGLGAYREGRWKLKLAVEGGESLYARYDHGDLLFDLEADPGEQNDLAAAMPRQVEELRRRLLELATELGVPAGTAGGLSPSRRAPSTGRPGRGRGTSPSSAGR
jgi:arylsulfatase A-like enzyme